MKHHSPLIALAFVFAGSANAAMTFVHPGAMSSKAELDFVKDKIALGLDPWMKSFNQMKSVATAGGATAPDTSNPKSEDLQKADGRKAYANALAWYFTGDVKYANQAIGILNVWAKTFAGYTMPPVGQGNQKQLVAAWIGALLGPAADIMRGYSGWAPADMAAVQSFFKTKFYPILNQVSTWNGNVDLTQIDAIMNIAVFNEDEAEFNLGLARLKKRDPAYFYLTTDPPSALNYANSNASQWNSGDSHGGPAPTLWVDGLTQETCRDYTHHAQYAMASAFHAAEVAWHQGVDVYTANTKRYTSVLELMALQITSGNMQGTCDNATTSKDLFDTWEVGYNHYHNRKGLALPNTQKVITQKIRPSGASDWNIFFETLTHADLTIPTGIVDRGNKGGQNSVSVSLQHDGMCEMLSNTTETVDLSVTSLDGKQLNQSLVRLAAGESRSVSLGMERAPAGVYLVQVRSNEGNTVLKFAK